LHRRSLLHGDSAADQVELPGVSLTRAHYVRGAQLDAAVDRDVVLAAIAVEILAYRSAGIGHHVGRKAGGSEEFDDGTGIAIYLGLDRGQFIALGGEVHRPVREVCGDVAFGQAAHGDCPVGHACPPQPVSEQITADDDTDGNDHRSDQGDIARDGASFGHVRAPLARAKVRTVARSLIRPMNRAFMTTKR
jgi:hypothetical protein